MRTSNLIQAIIAIAFTFVTLPTYSQTESWPKRPIKFVVGFGPGGANDIVARIVADGVSKQLGQSVIVENKPGAGSVLGADFVAKSTPDGYTFFVSAGGIITNPMIKKTMPYKEGDLVPVALLAVSPSIIVVPADSNIKTLKDFVAKAKRMEGFFAPLVPGWDCHGLPIEWKIEEQYRAKGKNKDEVPVIEFRKECRNFAEHWLSVQREEFKRLGITGDWDHPYSTMAFHAEAQIAREIMKFKDNGLLYRGSKPVMWSVVEKTALAEAEIEYQDYQSDAVWVKFPISKGAHAGKAVSAYRACCWR